MEGHVNGYFNSHIGGVKPIDGNIEYMQCRRTVVAIFLAFVATDMFNAVCFVSLYVPNVTRREISALTYVH
jgi:ABC-type enterobactin transport system permease subunit